MNNRKLPLDWVLLYNRAYLLFLHKLVLRHIKFLVFFLVIKSHFVYPFIYWFNNLGFIALQTEIYLMSNRINFPLAIHRVHRAETTGTCAYDTIVFDKLQEGTLSDGVLKYAKYLGCLQGMILRHSGGCMYCY